MKKKKKKKGKPSTTPLPHYAFAMFHVRDRNAVAESKIHCEALKWWFMRA